MGSGVGVDGAVQLDGHLDAGVLLLEELVLLELNREQLCFGHLALPIGVVHPRQVRQEVHDASSIAVHASLDVLERVTYDTAYVLGSEVQLR